jgi:hypothetical protein
VPLNTNKKPPIKYFQKRMMVVMTRQKMAMMMETMAIGNQIEKSNLVISWRKNGVSSHHSKNNQITQWK